MTRRVCVGVSGHRLDQLPRDDTPRLERLVARTMDCIATAAAGAAQAPVRMALVSALAEGADRIAAHAALARGWRLIAPLPFGPTRYERDFPAARSRSEFRTLCEAADVHVPRGRGGYLAAGLMLLNESDVLMALWNGQPPRGPGGTADVAARALAAGAPVVWVHTRPRRAPRFIAPHAPARRGSYRARFHAALAESFGVERQPPAMHICAA